ncbi:hypothetical protein M9X92_004853 [Pyricularia oryzae]|nr:hypothetical protein M9X92_004853 [Pyricularia oryzae]
MRSIGLWPWFKDQGLIPLEMPFAVCNLPRVMRLLQSDISAKRTPLPAFQLKINAQYLEQKCIALIIEACGNARVRHEGCQQCFSLGLECITAYGLGPVAEEVANHSCARCLFNEKSCMGPGKTCSLRDQNSAGNPAPKPSQARDGSIPQRTYVDLTREHPTQSGAGSGSAGASSTAVLSATPTTDKTQHPAAANPNRPLPIIPQKRQATDVPRINTQGLVAQRRAQPIPNQQPSYGQTDAPRLLEPSRQPRRRYLAPKVTQQAPGVSAAANSLTLTQQTPSQTRQYIWQPPTPVAQQETPYPHDATQPPMKRKRGRPPKNRNAQSRPPMQVWVGNVPIEQYSDEQLAAGISVFTAELNRRKFGTQYPEHFSPRRAIFTPAMPVTIPQVSAPLGSSQVHSQDRLQATASDPSRAVSGYGSGVYQTNLSGPSQISGTQPQTSQGGSMGASHGKDMTSPSTTSQLISPPSSLGPRHSPLPLESAQESRATGSANGTTPLQQETTVQKSTKSGSVANSSTQAKLGTGDSSEPTLASTSGPSTTPWGQVSRSPSEVASVRPSDGPAVFIKNETGNGMPPTGQPASIATAALCLATNLAKSEEGGGGGDQRQSSPRVKIERD